MRGRSVLDRVSRVGGLCAVEESPGPPSAGHGSYIITYNIPIAE